MFELDISLGTKCTKFRSCAYKKMTPKIVKSPQDPAERIIYTPLLQSNVIPDFVITPKVPFKIMNTR